MHYATRILNSRVLKEGTMATIGIQRDRPGVVTEPLLARPWVRNGLLACGFLASLLYVGTDITGGWLYPGYSFSSQAISELGAIDSPAKTFVDLLFPIYQLMLVGFGLGVYHEAAEQNRPLRITGAALILYGAIGVAISFAASFVAMHERGTASVVFDASHTIVSAVFVALLLIAIGSGAFAYGRVWRAYSLITLLMVIVFGALTAPFAARLATGQSTAGLGILERICVYSSLLWVAALACVLRYGEDAKPVYRESI